MSPVSLSRMARGLPLWLAVGVCLSVIALTRFGDQIISEWQRSSNLLSVRRAGVTADLFVKALKRDMEAVQTSVLVSPNWDDDVLESPYELRSLVASAFARYPYPESFFAAHQAIAPQTLVFFNRADRPARWATVPSPPSRFPVTIQSDLVTAQLLVTRMTRDAMLGRRFSVFDAHLGGNSYQVVVRLLYRDRLRQNLSGAFGFTVDLAWARQHYFSELTQQVAKVGGVRDSFGLHVIDDRNRVVTNSVPVGSDRTTARRTFRLMFFDPAIVALDPPSDLDTGGEWAVEVEDLSSPRLDVAVQSANRTLIVWSLSAVALAFGLVLTARANRARARLTEMRSEFVSTVTHELKTPLASIRAAADTLVADRFTRADGPRDYARLIVQESQRLARLVDNLLAYARITDVTEVYSFEPLDLPLLIADALKRFEPALRRKTFTVRTAIDPDVHLVHADQTALELLLDNLIDNAIRYSSAGGQLIVSARRGERCTTLEVGDHGAGIHPSELEKVTRRFYRGKGAASGGSGLGLAIASRIASDHGGHLIIDSELDRGTTVTVSFRDVLPPS